MKKSTKFQPGKSGNPLGRPVGSRNKLSETFVSDLQELWVEQGSEILRRVAEESPDKLLAAMVQVLPKDFQVSVSNDSTHWVINAQPTLTTLEWLQENGLDVIESPKPVMLENDQ